VKIRAIRVKFRLLPKENYHHITPFISRNFMNRTPTGRAGRLPQTIHFTKPGRGRGRGLAFSRRRVNGAMAKIVDWLYNFVYSAARG
jgi:hypothetical protein